MIVLQAILLFIILSGCHGELIAMFIGLPNEAYEACAPRGHRGGGDSHVGGDHGG